MAFVAADTFPLAVIAEIEFTNTDAFAFGDTDHDGANEVVLRSTDYPYNYRILEEQGNNVYTVEYTGAPLIPYAVGDLDRDGDSEIIGQWGSQVRVYEGVDATSYPTRLVWCSPDLTNIEGWTAIGDTDRDGRMEIIHSENLGGGFTGFLLIYENTGDNTFALVFRGTVSGTANTGKKLIADLDGDGRTEIAICGTEGWLHVFESPCNDVWELTARLWTGMYNAYSVDGGRDTDGNGKPEIFVQGNVFSDSTAFFRTMVYESRADNSFQCVATFSMEQGVAVTYNATANLDGVGLDEYITATLSLRVFRATLPGQWELITTSQGLGGAVYPFDLNDNGLPELILRSHSATVVLEYSPRATVVGPVPRPWQTGLAVFPNPCHTEAALQVARPLDVKSRLSVYDVAGRLVERRYVHDPRQPILWDTQDLRSGIYILRLDDLNGHTVATGRATILH